MKNEQELYVYENVLHNLSVFNLYDNYVPTSSAPVGYVFPCECCGNLPLFTPASVFFVNNVAWLPCLDEYPPVISPVIASTQSIATQTFRDENPDKFVLTSKEQQDFRKLYPLRSNSLLPPRAPKDNRPTLVLDLDETLIHTTFEVPPDPHNLEKLFVNIRPYLRTFLKAVSQWYEIVIYTASLPAYADRILDGLDPSRSIFSHRLYREHCSFFNGIYVKDIETLGRPIDKIVFVDNFPGAYMMQPMNALPVRSFLGSVNDSELFQLIKLLKILKHKDDVRPLLNRYRNHWKKIHFGSSQEKESEEHDEQTRS